MAGVGVAWPTASAGRSPLRHLAALAPHLDAHLGGSGGTPGIITERCKPPIFGQNDGLEHSR